MSSAFGMATDLLNDLRQLLSGLLLKSAPAKDRYGLSFPFPIPHLLGLSFLREKAVFASVCTSSVPEQYLVLGGIWCLQLPGILGSGISPTTLK